MDSYEENHNYPLESYPLIISPGYTFPNLDPYSLASGKRFSMENDSISGKTPIFSFTLDRDRLAVLGTGSD